MATISPSESARLEALARYGVLDSDPEQAFEDLATIAAAICGVPIALVSFVAEDRQWFKAERGLGVRETGRDVSFCAHTLNTHETLVVPDARDDPRFRENALVTGEPGIRFYAGAPIVTSDGHALGTVCVIDREPRTISPPQLTALQALARQASSLLEQRISSAANAGLAAEASGARERLQVAMDGAELAAWYYDHEKKIVGGDARMAELFGLDVPEGPAELWLEAIVAEDRERVRREFAAHPEGVLYDTKFRVMVEGKICWLHARAKVSSAQGGSVRMTGICEDVSREEVLARDLAKTAERLEIAQTASGASTFDWNLQSNTVKWTGTSFGRPPAELTEASKVFALIHEADREELERVITRAIQTGERYHQQCRAYWPDGSLHWIATAGKPLRDEAGTVVSVVGVNVDITDRKLTEEVLLRTEKLAAVGRLASTISHEINNPLEAVTNLLYILRHSPSLTQTDRDHLEQADRELGRVTQIAAQNLRFHRAPAAATVVRAPEIIDETLGLFASRLADSGIAVKLDVGANVTFSAFEGDIRQVLNNLVGNAFDVMRQGGTLSIRARCATDWIDGRKGASITVADSGPGVAPAVRLRLFEAFFSTKGIHGSGLGLWISKRIVHKHKGRLGFRTSTGAAHGTVFRLWLPFAATIGAGDPWTDAIG